MQPACLVWRPAPAGRNKLFGMVDLQQRNDSLLESFFNTTPLRNKALVFPALNPGTSNSYFPVRFFSSPCGKVKNGACISGPSPYGSRPIIVAPDQAGRKIRENMVWGEIFPLSFLFLVPLSFLFLASLPFFPILPPDFFFFFFCGRCQDTIRSTKHHGAAVFFFAMTQLTHHVIHSYLVPAKTQLQQAARRTRPSA